MALRVVINFRDGTKNEWPDPKSHVIHSRGPRVVYREAVVSVIDAYGIETSFPLDTVSSVEETPEPRW